MKENIYPPMHTAEHILNQTMARFYDCGRSFSAHIEKKKSKCDYHFDHALTVDEIKKIEDQVNKIIDDNLSVTEEMIELEEAKQKYNLSRIPEDAVADQVRIVKVGDYDAVPCLGGHVKFTKEIGRFRIISSDYNDGVLRIRYKLLYNF